MGSVESGEHVDTSESSGIEKEAINLWSKEAIAQGLRGNSAECRSIDMKTADVTRKTQIGLEAMRISAQEEMQEARKGRSFVGKN